MIELISPYNLDYPSAVTNMVEKQSCTLYHVCFKTYDLKAELEKLKNVGFKQFGKILTSDIYGYEATGVFLFNKGMGLVELVQENRADE